MSSSRSTTTSLDALEDAEPGPASFQDMLQQANAAASTASLERGSPTPEVSSVSQVIFESCWRRFEEKYWLRVRTEGKPSMQAIHASHFAQSPPRKVVPPAAHLTLPSPLT
jgi:hypothetical protein